MPSSTGPSIETITEGGRVTQVGEGQEADEAAPSVMTFGSPTVGGRVDPTARDVEWGGTDDLEAWAASNEEG